MKKDTCFIVLAVTLLRIFVCELHAHEPMRAERLPEIDQRRAGQAAAVIPSETEEAAVATLRLRLPHSKVDWDAHTKAPRLIQSADGFLTGRDGEGRGVGAAGARAVAGKDPLRPVKTFLTEHRPLFGHGPEALDKADLKRDHTDAHNGLRTVIWQQKVYEIPVFEALFKAHLTKHGELVNIGSGWVRDAAAAADGGVPNRAGLKAARRIDAAEALALAASSVGAPVAREQVTAAGEAAGITRRQTFTAEHVSDASAELVWLPLDAGTLRLCWQTILTSMARGEMFLSLVDVETGELLLRRSLTDDLSDATYRVFTSDSPTPSSPGLATPGSAQPPLVPRALVTTPALNTLASPNGWIDDGVNETRGNNVDAHTDLDANNVADTPRPQGSPNRVFDFPLDLTQAPSTYKDAAVTQLFYWCNFIHDKLYELGFTEAAGNFQNNNFGRGGVGNDAVQADAQDGSGTNNANFSTPPDGSPGRMQMFLWTGPNPDIDGDFDAEVVLHEYTHGLTNRLVGGGVGLSALQSQGMGEGWSDFYGMALLTEASDNVDGNWARGGYSRTLYNGTFTENYYFGGRRYPYSTDLTKNPLTFKDINPAQASAHTGIPRNPNVGTTADEVHNSGEVWCVTLWEVRAALVKKHGFAVGNQLTLQLVTDGLKLSVANPNFLQARDAILQAELVLTGGANRNELWTAFAKRGMGASASSPASSTTVGLVEAYDLPDDLTVSPTGSFTSNGSIGGPFSPSAQVYTLRNTGAAVLSWTATATPSWLTLSATSGTLAPGATVDVTATINSGANLLAAGSFTGTVTFQNVANGATSSRPVSLTVSAPRVAYFALDTNPGWTTTGQWAFGHPIGAGGGSYGSPDPSNGATGANVLGVNLSGNYSTATGGPYYVTTPALNLTGYTATRLEFQRWLNTDYQNYAYATVEVSNNGTTWTQIFNNGATIYADSAWTKVSYDISAIADNRSTVYIRWGYQIGTGAFAYSGWNIDDIAILGMTAAEVAVTMPASATEGAVAVAGTVTATPAPVSDLVVSLTSGTPSRLAVPPSVTIPAGATSAPFPMIVHDDALLNGSAAVTVTPSATGRTPRGASITIHDNETSSLTVTLPASATEGIGSVAGSVTSLVAPDSNITVQLSSNQPGDALPPATVTIPAGQKTANFSLAIVNDSLIDGTQPVTITASVANWVGGSAVIDIFDNESTDLSLSAPASVRESDAGKTGTVSITGTLPVPLVVALSSSDSTEFTVPATVTIPAGQTSASFAITVIDDTEADGTQTAQITATATGFTSAQASVSVLDNDAHHFAFGVIPSPQVRGLPFQITVTAQDVNGVTITDYASTPALSGAGASGAVTVTPAVTAAFSNGVWTGNVAVGTYATGVVLTVSDGGGHTGTSNAFDVTSGAFDHFTWDAVPSPQVMDTPFPGSLTAADAAGNPVDSFHGSADLAVLSNVANPPIGTSNVTSLTPLYGYYAKSRTQTLYLASEIGGAARLTSLALYFPLNSAQTFSNWTIRLKHTTLGSFATASWDATGWTVVHQSNFTPATSGWVTFNFQTPFDFDGTSNLLVDFSFNNTAAVGTVDCRHSPATGRMLYGYASTGDPLTWAGATAPTPFPGSTLPNVQFTVERALAIRPASATLSNGVWTGNLSVPFSGAGLRLRATDAAGHRGDSNSFTVTPPAPAGGIGGALVFAEDFESGTLGSAWTISGTANYRTQVTTANLPHGGTRHLTMDSSVDGTLARNEATLTTNLLGRTGVVLTFWAKNFNDEANGPPTSPFAGGADFDGVAISADGSNWYEVQSLRTPAVSGTWAQFTVNLDAAIAARGLAYTSAFKIRFNQYDDYAIATDGIAIDDISLTATPISILTLALPAQATEGAGALPGSVTLPAAQGADVTVTLSSNAPAKVTVPASVTVPAGQTSASFAVTVLDDAVLDGTKTVTIAATATGLNPGSATLQVLDNEAATLTLNVPVSVAEGAGSTTGTLTILPAPSGTLTVALTSSDTTAAQVPATLTFSAGQTSASFAITVVNDTKIDGTQSAVITASLAGSSSATATMQVTDNETLLLTITLATSGYEGTAPTGSVSISGTLDSPLVVSLTSSDPAQCAVPASVTIPAGLLSASFAATAVDDSLTDGTQNVTITASAATFTSGTKNFAVLDNDVHHFAISTIASPRVTNTPVSVTITAQDVNNSTITTHASSATLSATGDGGAVALSPGTTGLFFSGVWTGNITLLSAGTNVRLSATAVGKTGTSNAFDVQSAPVIGLTPASLTMSLPQGSSTTRTLNLANMGGSFLTWSLNASAPANEAATEGATTGAAPSRSFIQGETSDALSSLTLASALANLNANHAAVRSAIPTRYAFLDGVTGSFINDGGNDMYDDGNYLYTNVNLSTPLAYSDNAIVSSALLGAGGSYFTRKYDGLWVFAANVSGLTYLQTSGGLGADGSGSTDSAILSVVRGGITYRGFVKRVYNAGDPSVNHLFIVADNGSVTQTSTADTNDDYHLLNNLNGVTRIYYLLYAGTGGAYINNTSTLGIMNAFLDAVSTPDWISVTPGSGSVSGGTSLNLTVTIDTAALSAGTYNRTLTITSNDPATPSLSVPVALTVTSEGNLQVSPAGGLTSTGLRGGPFSPASQTFTVTNAGGQSLAWTVAKSAGWVDLDSVGGTLAPGATTTVTATLNAGANSLSSGSYSDTVTFTNTTNGFGNTTRPLSLTATPVGSLVVTPGTNLDATGLVGGPFSPASQTYTLSNPGDASINWTAAKTASWLSLSSTSGTLAAGASTTITATIGGAALTPALYSDTITFTNTTNTRGNTTRAVTLTVVIPSPVLAAEPAITPATSNTVTWNAVAGVDGYEVQCATDAAFTNPIGSGLITGTSHTFTGLVDGAPYYYRVRARKISAAQTGAWMQTSQAEFSTGTLSSVSASAMPGSILLSTSSGVQTFSEAFDEAGTAWSSTIFPDATAGTFTRGVPTAGPNTTPALPINQGSDLTARSVGGTAFALRNDVAANRFTDGSIEAYLAPENSSTLTHAGLLLRASRTGGQVNGYAAVILFQSNGVSKVDFARVTNNTYATLSGWFYSNTLPFTVGANENIRMKFDVSGSTLSLRVWRVAISGGLVVETPITLTGSSTVLTATDTAYPSGGLPGLLAYAPAGTPVLYDDVSITQPAALGYVSGGTLTSPLITPAPLAAWGQVQYTRDISPTGVALTVDVLNAAGAVLAVNVASGTDLNTLPAVAGQPSLRLRANLSSSNSANSPRLDDWTVNYISTASQTFYSAWSAPESSTQFNAPPTISAVGGQSILEDGATAALGFTVSDDSTPTGNLVLTALSSNPALIPAAGLQLGGAGANRTIRVTPAPNASGAAIITLRAVDEGGKVTDLPFPVTVAPVNDAPFFLKGANQVVLENSGAASVLGWASGINAGPPDEAGQSVEFRVVHNNPGLFSVPPAVAPDGRLTFTPAPSANGTAVVALTLVDNGGTADGGADTSAPQTFTIDVTAVNSAPSFTKGANVSVLEDAGPRKIAGWATQISAGPADEAAQALDFIVTNDNESLFSAAPTIAANGELSFTPAPDRNGSALVTVRLHDGGGTANGGVDTSAALTFVITVTAVNDAPGFAKGANQTVLENSGAASVPAWASGITAGPADEAAQTVEFRVVNDNPTLFEAPPAVAPDGRLTFTPAVAANGTARVTVTLVDDGGTADGGVDTSGPQTFTITVTAINDAPSFMKGANLSVLEDAGAQVIVGWASQISAGPGDEAGQALDFVVENDNPTLFSAAPTITADGELSFTPAPDRNGSAHVTVHLHDDGGTEDHGVDASAPQTFTITVGAVNDKPAFAKGASQFAPQNSGPKTVVAWATAISSGPEDEAAQTVEFLVSNDNAALFTTPPAIAPDGTLTFTPAPDARGTANVTVRLRDSGGVDHGGSDTSAAESFTIATGYVNDAPSFVSGPNRETAQDAGPQSVQGWATQISPGPADEASQSLEFLVSVDQPALFATPPAISRDGTLTYTPAKKSGTANVTVRLRDNGGTDDGGQDTSAPQTFTIAITSYLEEAGTYNGLVTPAREVADFRTFGLLRITFARTGAFTGRLVLGGKPTNLSGIVDQAGVAHFGRARAGTVAIPRTDGKPLSFSFKVDVARGTDTLQGKIEDESDVFAIFTADRALFTAARKPAPPMRNVPPELLGAYTVVFAPRTLSLGEQNTFTTAPGYGSGLATVGANGTIRLVANLADGTAITYANQLSKSPAWPLYHANAAGYVISGPVSFQDVAEKSDFEGANLLWCPVAKRSVPALPPPLPMRIDLVGARYDRKAALIRDLLPAGPEGNTMLSLADGGLDPLGAHQPINFGMHTAVSANPRVFTFRINPGTGLFTGAFKHPVSGAPATLRGAILQKQNMGAGAFRTKDGAGSLTLIPQQ